MENAVAKRYRLPEERLSVTHKFKVADYKGYITIGLFKDGRPGEMFIRIAKEGSTLSGLLDSFAVMVSIALQYGVPLKMICDKFKGVRFEPEGYSGNEEVGYATSIVDYIFRWMEIRFLGVDPAATSNVLVSNFQQKDQVNLELVKAIKSGFIPEMNKLDNFILTSDAPVCKFCGSITQRNGSCYVCIQCGATTGCS